LTLVGCLLEYNAIFVFYGRILKLAISSSVTGTVVLNLDYHTPELTAGKIQDIFHKRCIFAPSSNITYQHCQSATCFQCFEAALQTKHEEFAELLIILIVAQVIGIVAVLNDAPIRRVYPAEVELAGKFLLR